MNAIIDAIYRDGQFIGRDGEAIIKPLPASIDRSEGESLYRMVRDLKPKRTLEVGLAWGISTLFMCQGLEDNGEGHHTAIDPYQCAFEQLGVYNVERAGLKHRLTVYEEESQLVLPRLVDGKQKFDLVFIDGSHLFDAAFIDFFYADRLIPVGGLLVFDDLWMPAIRKMLHFIVNNRNYEIAEEFLGPRRTFVNHHLANLAHWIGEGFRGRATSGVPSQWKFHRGRTANWCALRKTAEDKREWHHFVHF